MDKSGRGAVPPGEFGYARPRRTARLIALFARAVEIADKPDAAKELLAHIEKWIIVE